MAKIKAYIGRQPIENADLDLLVLTTGYQNLNFVFPRGQGLAEVLRYAEKEGCTHWLPRGGADDPRSREQLVRDSRIHTDAPFMCVLIYPRNYETNGETE